MKVWKQNQFCFYIIYYFSKTWKPTLHHSLFFIEKKLFYGLFFNNTLWSFPSITYFFCVFFFFDKTYFFCVSIIFFSQKKYITFFQRNMRENNKQIIHNRTANIFLYGVRQFFNCQYNFIKLIYIFVIIYELSRIIFYHFDII
jgi:hypothetical protein